MAQGLLMLRLVLFPTLLRWFPASSLSTWTQSVSEYKSLAGLSRLATKYAACIVSTERMFPDQRHECHATRPRGDDEFLT